METHVGFQHQPAKGFLEKTMLEALSDDGSMVAMAYHADICRQE